MAYTLTLTPGQRQAFDFVGGRYEHGHDLWSLITDGTRTTDTEEIEWDDTEADITWTFTEPEAWAINDLCKGIDYQFTCFDDELSSKLINFCNGIV